MGAMAHRLDYVRGRSVVEVGAGLGLAGLVSAQIGARSVYLTDLSPTVLKALEANVHKSMQLY